MLNVTHFAKVNWIIIMVMNLLFNNNVNGNFQFLKKVDMANIFFITGTSGSGKSSLTQLLKMHLPKSRFEVNDFDENGVPDDADKSWRQATTDYWLTKAQENALKKRSTIICGVIMPSEVLSSPKKPSISIHFGFIKISNEKITERLKARGWDDQLIQDNINWAHYLEAELKKESGSIVIESCLNSPPELIASKFIKWINSLD